MPYLTPDTLTGDCFLRLRVPNDRLARVAVIGQLTDLCKESFWETFGSSSAEQTALEFLDRFTDLSFSCYPAKMLSEVGSAWVLESCIGVYEIYHASILIDAYNPPTPNTSLPLKLTSKTLTISTTDNTGNVLGNSGGTEFWMGQSFVPLIDGTLSQINVRFGANTGTPSGQVRWQLREDSSGNPSSTIADSGLFTPTQNSTNTINITSSVELMAGAIYWIVFRCDSAQATGVFFTIRTDSTNPYSGGQRTVSTNGGSSWSPQTVSDIRMSLVLSGTATRDKLGQAFVVPLSVAGLDLDTLRLSLRKQGTPSGNLTAKIYTDSTGEPNSLLATSDNVAVSSLSTSFTWVSFTFPTPYTPASAQYWIVLETSDSGSLDNWVEWQAQAD